MLKTIEAVDVSILMPIKADINGVLGGDVGLDPILPKTKKRNLTKSKILANLKFYINVGITGLLISKARRAFTQSGQAFTKALILRYCNLKCYIKIERDPSGYTKGGVLSQLTFNQLVFNQISPGQVALEPK